MTASPFDGIWKTSKGKKMPIRKMDDRHFKNSIALSMRMGWTDEKFDALLREQDRRTHDRLADRLTRELFAWNMAERNRSRRRLLFGTLLLLELLYIYL